MPLNPENELETLVLAEIFMLHNTFSEMNRRLMLTDDPKHADSIVNRIDKLTRSIRESVSALQKLRGKATQQRVIVEHVNVEPGGQAIVGAVSQTGGEGKHS